MLTPSPVTDPKGKEEKPQPTQSKKQDFNLKTFWSNSIFISLQ